MDKDFHVFDFHRIFFGDLPYAYLLEIVFRTLIMYTYTVILLRILGKRGMGQMSTLELAIIVSFGSAIGDPMMGAEMPIIHGMVAVTVITVFQITLERFINRNKKIEAILEGTANLIVENGTIQWKHMIKDNISKEDLFRTLRNKDVEHLGQVQKAFFETTGQISVIFNPPKKTSPGLSVLPNEEIEERLLFTPDKHVEKDGIYCCLNCGNRKQYNAGSTVKKCEKCDQDKWVSV